MSERPHFSNRTLKLGSKLGNNWLGYIIARPFDGSSSPNKVRAHWVSDVESEGGEWIQTPGDSVAGLLRRNWINAMVASTPDEEIKRLEASQSSRPIREAVAFRVEGMVHVGIHQRQVALFGRLNGGRYDGEFAAGMRVGRGPLEMSMGVWLPSEEIFIGANVVHQAWERVHIDQLSPLSQNLSRVPLVI